MGGFCGDFNAFGESMDVTVLKEKFGATIAEFPTRFIRRPAQATLRSREIFSSPAQREIFDWILVLTESRSCLGEAVRSRTEPTTNEDLAALTGYTCRTIDDATSDGVKRGVFLRDKKSQFWIDAEGLSKVRSREEFEAEEETETIELEPDPEVPVEVQRVSVAPGSAGYSLRLTRPVRVIELQTSGKDAANFTIQQTVKGVIVSLLDGLTALVGGEQKENRNNFRSDAPKDPVPAKGEEKADRNLFRCEQRDTLRAQVDEQIFEPLAFGEVTDWLWAQVLEQAGSTPDDSLLDFFHAKIKVFKSQKKPISPGIFPSWAKFASKSWAEQQAKEEKRQQTQAQRSKERRTDADLTFEYEQFREEWAREKLSQLTLDDRIGMERQAKDDLKRQGRLAKITPDVALQEIDQMMLVKLAKEAPSYDEWLATQRVAV